MKNIFVISGGGVGGIIAANALTKVNAIPDLIVGTSVGSILGAYISVYKETKNTAAIFREAAENIFAKKHLIPPKYKIQEAVNYLDKEIFKNAKCSDCEIPLIISTTDLVRDVTVYLNNDAEYAKNIKLAEFIRPSFAAPFYFEYMRDEIYKQILSDGGVGYNNFPIMPAVIEMTKRGFMSEECNIYAFGTGFGEEDYEKEYKRLSKSSWLRGVAEYLSIKSGGFARKSSYREQINAGKNIGNSLPNINFTYYDAIIKKPYSLDDVKAIDSLARLEIRTDL